jgi:hypothetical protein
MAPRTEPVEGEPETVRRLPALASSVSAAEKLADTDPEYLAHLEAEHLATFHKNMAYNRMIANRLRAFSRILDRAQPTLQGLPVDSVLDFDAVRNRADDREQLKGGVPQ